MIYVTYTKSRSDKELVEQLTRELGEHPEWATNLDISLRRFFRVEAESNYISQEFTHFSADSKKIIQKTPTKGQTCCKNRRKNCGDPFWFD